jgi:D-sedoheptulose 7-phosphate isomerase
MTKITDIITRSIKLKQDILNNTVLIERIENAVDIIIAAYRNKGKVLLCGNGGSAADAQHLAAELSGRFYMNRPPLNAEALHVNTSYLTAVANDFSYAEVYSRSIEAKGFKGDVLVAISTSGNSENIVKAAHKAKEIGLTVIGFTGKYGGKLKEECSLMINVPSEDTPRIQEAHILIGHIICELVESKLFSEKYTRA